MSKPAKIFTGILLTLIIVGIGLFFTFRHLITKSFPQTTGSLNLPGLQKPVAIIRDEWGVPHISASNEHDLMMGIGFVQAQDRLFQMELTFRAGEGRLSEVFDTATLSYDKLFRTLGFKSLAKNLERNLHPDSRRMLQDYTEGINAFIRLNKGNYPVEFDMLNIEPEEWTVQRSLLVARLMAWELNFSWWEDLTYAEIANRVGEEKFQEIILKDRRSHTSLSFPVIKTDVAQSIHSVLDIAYSYRQAFQIGAYTGGSNAWAVSGEKSVNKKPILANDPHLRISAPSKWYEMHITAPGWNVAGASLPGTPFIIIGHNDSLAWGFTNAMLDDADFYIEKEDSLKPYYYHFKNSILPMEVREETVLTKSGKSIPFTVRVTHHGPIINDVNVSLGHSALLNQSPVSFRWTGYEMTNEFHGFYLINRATTIVEFEHGLREIAVPGQTAVYADVQGNIAYWTAGQVPVRSKGNPTLPLNGVSGDMEWAGFLPFEQLPSERNPSRGYIVCANNVLGDAGYSRYLSTLWEPPYRFNRISDLLSSGDNFSEEDFTQIQQDVVSYHARDLSKYILDAYSGDTSSSPNIEHALEYLRSWDYRCATGDIATTIFNEFFVRLLHNTFEDEMGPEVFRDFVFVSAVPYRVTTQLLASDSSSWFDNIATPEIETRNIIIRQSFANALDTLRQILGDEMKTWQWGRVHDITIEHPFGKRKPLDMVFNSGPFPVAGSATTICKGDFKLSAPFHFFAGPSMRQIVDLANPVEALMVNPLGQSGQAFHRHYDDQTTLWLSGGNRTVTIEWKVIERQQWDRLELVPAQ